MYYYAVDYAWINKSSTGIHYKIEGVTKHPHTKKIVCEWEFEFDVDKPPEEARTNVSHIQNLTWNIYKPLDSGMRNLGDPEYFFDQYLKKRLFMYAHRDKLKIGVNHSPSKQNPVRLPSDRYYSHYLKGIINPSDPYYSDYLKGN
ncbi:hypothetical protein [Bacillus sp. OV166]|uniref:hypothetical protein n=1 Tax=Bacillus sp. OV166 TaxID=1882763 RepID=UPI000B43DAC2|nr:hypothetical protein [Bacillus sp. OV166]